MRQSGKAGVLMEGPADSQSCLSCFPPGPLEQSHGENLLRRHKRLHGGFQSLLVALQWNLRIPQLTCSSVLLLSSLFLPERPCWALTSLLHTELKWDLLARQPHHFSQRAQRNASHEMVSPLSVMKEATDLGLSATKPCDHQLRR